MTDKQIKFQIVTDEQSVRRASRLIQDLTRDVQKLVETLQRVNLGGIGGGQGGGQRNNPFGGVGFSSGAVGGRPQRAQAQNPFGQVGQRLTQGLSDQASVFRAISHGSRDVLRAMSSELDNNISKQKRMLDSQASSVERLAKKYHDLKKAADFWKGTPGGAPNVAQAREEAAHAFVRMNNALAAQDTTRNQLEATRRQRQQVAVAMGEAAPEAADGTPSPPKARMTKEDMLLLGGTIAKAIGGGMATAGGVIQQHKTMKEANLAAITRGPARFLGGMLSGDLRDFYYMQQESLLGGGKLGKQIDERYGGTKAAYAMGIGETLGHIGEGAIGLAAMGTGLGAGIKVAGTAAQRAMAAKTHHRPGGAMFTAGDVAGMGSGVISSGFHAYHSAANLLAGGPQAQEMATMMAGLDFAKASQPLKEAIFDTLMAERGIRLSGSRALMGRHMSTRGGAFTFGESVAMGTQMNQLMGLRGMFDTTRKATQRDIEERMIARGTDLGRLNDIIRYDGQTYEEKRGYRPFKGETHAQKRTRYMNAEINAKRLKRQIEASFDDPVRVRGALSLFKSLRNTGFDEGMMGSFTSGSMAMGGGQEGAQKFYNAIRTAVHLGTREGFTDRRTQSEIVNYMAQATSGVVARGTAGTTALASLMTAGLGGTQGTLADMQSRRRVIGGIDSLYKNNQFFQGVSIAQSKRMLGPGAANSAVAFMAGMSPTQLLANMGSEQFEAFGISNDMALKAARERIEAPIRALGNMDPEFKAEYDRVGGDISKMSRRSLLRGVSNLGISPTGRDAESLVQLLRSGGLKTKAGMAELSSVLDGAAAKSVSVEEQAKMAIMGTEAGKAIKSWLTANFDPKEFIQQIEKANKQFDLEAAIKENKVIVVKIVDTLERQQTANKPKESPP